VRIVLDKSKCSSIGICESLAPEYFEVDDDGAVIVKREIVDGGALGVVEKAVAECPAAALALVKE